MKRPPLTAAEQQIEALRNLKQAQAKRKAKPVPPAPPAVPAPVPARLQAAMPVGLAPGEADAPAGQAFELSEGSRPKAKLDGPALPLSPQVWRRLRARQREHREFKRRREMGDWAAELLLALPPHAHKMGDASRQDLFDRLREWAQARGL
jgi:hypothetical protein